MPRQTKPVLTTSQRLDSIVKSARKIMRKDKGLNGELDRLPVLTWVMFLKFLDDKERLDEERAELAGRPFRPAISRPYRWRDWAAQAGGISGPDLISFINDQKTTRPDGTEGPGLFAYLRSLANGDGKDRRDVVATVFRGVTNRMESGYLLRDVINLVDEIHFDSSEELHTLGRLYESLLREMRDAAGDSGEFYTPRSVVRFMVEVTDPRLGERVLDPACGTGGFLTETHQHLERQCRTVEDREILQTRSLLGIEPKSLPYLLAEMNLLLHGLEAPQIEQANALRHRLSALGEADRVEVILTNPPFGGEEEVGILGNFPEDRRSTNTELLFLQLIMRRLRRGGRGRAAVVVPNGLLFGDGVAARLREDLLTQFNLHTIVRLPEGVFAPYADLSTNLLFLDTSGPTETIWYYELPLPEGRRKYTKLKPLQFEEFGSCLAWWADRSEGPQTWKLDFAARKAKAAQAAEPHYTRARAAEERAAELAAKARKAGGDDALQRASAEAVAEAGEARRAGDALYWPAFNLDLQNPNTREGADDRSASSLIESALRKEEEIVDLLRQMQSALLEPVS